MARKPPFNVSMGSAVNFNVYSVSMLLYGIAFLEQIQTSVGTVYSIFCGDQNQRNPNRNFL